MDWRAEAACRGMDTELFFPVTDQGPCVLQIRQAKAVCYGCPVTQECLSWALRTRQEFGVFGGMTEQERDHLVRYHRWERRRRLAARR